MKLLIAGSLLFLAGFLLGEVIKKLLKKLYQTQCWKNLVKSIIQEIPSDQDF